MDHVVVEKVKTKMNLAAFITFPWKIYKNDPNWVPPLIREMKEKLDRKKNPFFEHAEMDLFLAHRDGEVRGRIAAILDLNHNAFHQEKVAFFGFYESENEVETAQELLNTVMAWGKERGMETLRGPMSLSMNDECAFLLEGFDSPPVIMMPYNPPYYLELMGGCGLSKAKDLYAFLMTRDHKIAEKIEVIVEQMKRELSVVIRSANKKNFQPEVERIRTIYNSAWEKNWGFVPWTDEEVDYMAQKLLPIADMDLVLMAEDHGRPVGFALGLPNYNEVLKRLDGRITPLGLLKFLYYRKRIKSMRAIVFGIIQEYRQTGLSYYLYSELEKRAQQKGYEWGEMSWQLEDNEAVNRFNLSLGAKIYKKYRIFEKKIA